MAALPVIIVLVLVFATLYDSFFGQPDGLSIGYAPTLACARSRAAINASIAML